MGDYTGFRFGGRNAVLVRPNDRAPEVTGDTFARDRTSVGANDGTELDATWLNRLKANLEGLVVGLGGNLNDGDEQLLNAVLAKLDDYVAAADLAAALSGKANLTSPALTGTPTAPTADPGTASQQLATTAFVAAAVAALINASPGVLDTLDELAAALGDDPNFATTILTAVGGKLAKASNLSDLTDASAARTNLGLAIGDQVQAYHVLLADIAAATVAKGTLFVGTGAGTLGAFAVGANGKVPQADSGEPTGLKWVDLPSGASFASKAEAETGTENTKAMTALRVAEQMAALFVQPGCVARFAFNTAPAGWLKANGAAVSRSSYPALFAALVKSAVVTMTIATPGVVSWTAHGRSANDPIVFSTTGALPTGFTAGTVYYVVASGLTTDSFRLSTTPGGSAINTTGSQSGVHTAWHAPFGLGDGSTTFTLPDLRGEFDRGWDDGRGVDSNRAFGAAQADELKAHTHSCTAPVAQAQGYGGGNMIYANSTSATTGSTGGTETRPRNVALLACIKY